MPYYLLPTLHRDAENREKTKLCHEALLSILNQIKTIHLRFIRFCRGLHERDGIHNDIHFLFQITRGRKRR